jgi:hypothetical protein
MRQRWRTMRLAPKTPPRTSMRMSEIKRQSSLPPPASFSPKCQSHKTNNNETLSAHSVASNTPSRKREVWVSDFARCWTVKAARCAAFCDGELCWIVPGLGGGCERLHVPELRQERVLIVVADT